MFEQKIKALVAKQKENGSKKNIENLVVFLIILIVTIIAINTILKEDNNKKAENGVSTDKLLATDKLEEITPEEEDLAKKLEGILSKIDGVGKVKVLITYSQTSEVVAMYNENQKESATEETDTSGGIRKITETDNQREVIYKEENGEKQPVTQKLVMPKIEGAIVAAEGARNSEVKTYIIQAVEAATGLATHKIQVFAMQG